MTMNNLEEMKQKYAELGEAIKKLEEKKVWEPKGGEWIVYASGIVSHDAFLESRMFGTTFPTTKAAEKAARQMRRINRLRQYVIEHAPEHDYEGRGFKMLISSGVWVMSEVGNFPGLDITMPFEVAKELCQKLNSGEVVL